MKTSTVFGGLLAALVALLALVPAPASAAPGDLVVVAGANGRTGRLVVGQLLAAHYRVRALVRELPKASEAAAQGAEVRIADVRDPRTLGPALAGATYLISAIGASGGMNKAPGDGPAEVDSAGVRNLALAARAAHLRQVVLISSAATSRADSYPVAFMRPILKAKFEGEQALRASGVPYTIVKPGGLLDEPGGRPIAISQGDLASGRIPRADVAAVCVAALGAKAALGRSFEIVTGESADAADWDARFAALRADEPVKPAP